MRVVKSTADIEWEHNVVCPYCKSELCIDGNDIKFRLEVKESVHGRQHDWNEDLYYAVCAVCRKQMNLRGIAIPNVFRVRAKAAY